jgi:hypothetical protein
VLVLLHQLLLLLTGLAPLWLGHPSLTPLPPVAILLLLLLLLLLLQGSCMEASA